MEFYPDPPEEEVSDEFELFKPIIDAFVAKYPAVEFGPAHVVFGDYNLEKHWLLSAMKEIRDRRGEVTIQSSGDSKDFEAYHLFKHLIGICVLLGIE